jgi:hypothetical protein
MVPLHLSTYLTLSTYLAIAYAGTSAYITSDGYLSDHYFSTSTRYRTLEYVRVEQLLHPSLLTHGISPTILFQRCQPSGIGDNQECPAGINLKRYHCILNT